MARAADGSRDAAERRHGGAGHARVAFPQERLEEGDALGCADPAQQHGARALHEPARVAHERAQPADGRRAELHDEIGRPRRGGRLGLDHDHRS